MSVSIISTLGTATLTPSAPSSIIDEAAWTRPVIWMASMAVATLFLLFVSFCYFQRRARDRFVDDNAAAAASVVGEEAALGPDELGMIPVFVYKKLSEEDKLECSVCLGEFKERERGRVLPGCYHSFHVECVDTWFRSHNTCPMCRTTIRLENQPCGHTHMFRPNCA